MRNYIGLSCSFHDTALAIVDGDGELVFAEATERYLQNKRALAAAPDSLSRIGDLLETWCDPDAELVISRTWSRKFITATGILKGVLDLASGARAKLEQHLLDAGDPETLVSTLKLERLRWILASLSGITARTGTDLRFALQLERLARWRDGLRRGPGDGTLEAAGRSLTGRPDPRRQTGATARRLTLVDFDHHLTHAAAACFKSPFRDAVCAVIDGNGENGSAAFYHYRDGVLRRVRAGASPGSLGQFYTFLCFACGFDAVKGEEWKVMGLAPYGRLSSRLYETLRGLLRVDGLRVLPGPERRLPESLLPELCPAPREDLACAGQKVFEDLLYQLLRNLHARGLSENLVLTGGCALNSSANGKLLSRVPFKRLFVPSAPADDGNAVGAALLAHRRDHPDHRSRVGVQPPYLGSRMSEATLERLRTLGRAQGLSVHPGDVHLRAAGHLAEGHLVGWIQGRAEFGPRALGNRSILADPRRADIKDLINSRVKFREEFRPFAPSILHEFGESWFEDYQESPYMERTLRFRAEVIGRVPGVVHVDGTGRLQTVKLEWNERFYDLIRAFYELTGVPLLLNTSFNIMGKPIVHSVEDAIGMFHTTGLDALVIEDVLIEKPPF